MIKKVLSSILATFLVASVGSVYAAKPIKQDNSFNTIVVEKSDKSIVKPFKNNLTGFSVNSKEKPMLNSMQEFTEVDPADYYGRQALADVEVFEELDEGKLTDIYDTIKNGLENHEETIILDTFDQDTDSVEKGISPENVQTVFNALKNDCPQYYYASTYSYTYGEIEIGEEKYVLSFKPKYFDDYNDKKFTAIADALIKKSGVTPGMSDYEKSKCLHDTLAAWVEYDYESFEANEDNFSHTAYGAIVDKLAVCDGYSRAYQYLLYKVGVISHIVTGYGINNNGEAENHAWNVVQLDGEWYLTDLTWDDQEYETTYFYFNVNEDTMSCNHFPGLAIDGEMEIEQYPGYDLPYAEYMDMTYYYKESLYLDTSVAESEVDTTSLIGRIIERLKESPVVQLAVEDDDVFINWFGGYNQDSKEYYGNFEEIKDKFSSEISDGSLNYGWKTTGTGFAEIVIIPTDKNLNSYKNFQVAISGVSAGNYKIIQTVYDDSDILTDVNTFDIELDDDENAKAENKAFLKYYPLRNLKDDYKKVRYFLWNEEIGSVIPITKASEVNY